MSENKMRKALDFAVGKYGVDREKAAVFILRKVKWNIIKKFQCYGRIKKCEICGEEDYGEYWCHPCIHHQWCCECCILIGIPEYSVGIYFSGKDGIRGTSKMNLPCGEFLLR